MKQLEKSRKKPVFKTINAKVEQLEFFEIVIEAIQEQIKSIEHVPFDWPTHSKNAESHNR